MADKDAARNRALDPAFYKRLNADEYCKYASQLHSDREGTLRVVGMSSDHSEQPSDHSDQPCRQLLPTGLPGMCSDFVANVMGLSNHAHLFERPPDLSKAPVVYDGTKRSPGRPKRGQEVTDRNNNKKLRVLKGLVHSNTMATWNERIPLRNYDMPPLLELIHCRKETQLTYWVDGKDPLTVHEVRTEGQSDELRDGGCTQAKLLSHSPWGNVRTTEDRSVEEKIKRAAEYEEIARSLRAQCESTESGGAGVGTENLDGLEELNELPNAPNDPDKLIENCVFHVKKDDQTNMRPVMSYLTPEGTWSQDPKPQFSTTSGTARNWVLYFLAFMVPVPGISKRDGVWYFTGDDTDNTNTGENLYSAQAGRLSRLRKLAEAWKKEKVRGMTQKDARLFVMREAKRYYDAKKQQSL